MKNRKPWNVLVFPGGTENGLEINKSLRYAKEVILFSASSGVKNHAELMYENHFVISEVKNETCLIELNEIIRANSIDFVNLTSRLRGSGVSHSFYVYRHKWCPWFCSIFILASRVPLKSVPLNSPPRCAHS